MGQMKRELLFFACFMLAVTAFSQTAPEVAPEALEEEAKTLGTRSDLTVIGKKGLVIRGTNLEGDGVRRPSMLLARAAELYAERALASGDFGCFDGRDKALSIWEELQDWRTPVGYLRQFKKLHGKANPALAAACDFHIAQCYERQGDTESASAIYRSYATVPADNEHVGRCKALYALSLVKERSFKEAAEIAQEVKTKCPFRDIYREKLDAYGLALQVLGQIPPEIHPEAAQAAGADEAAILAGAKENPRKYLQLGQLAEQRDEKTKAAEYYQAFRKNFPTDATSIDLGLKLARMLVETKQVPKALETYQSVWVGNPNLPQAATARVEAAQLSVQSGRTDDAVKLIQEGIAASNVAEVKATLTAALAELYLTNRKPEEAAALYIQLMSQYGEQNAAKGAIDKLRTIAPRLKNWPNVVQQIFTWITGAKSGRPPYGIHELTPQAVSDLRRLALTLYVENNDFRGGLSWLQQCGAKSRDQDLNLIVLDEAWFYTECLRQAASAEAQKKLRATDYPGFIDMGLRGWNIAKQSPEGWESLKAAAAFIKTIKPRTDRVKKLCDELKALKGTPYAEEANDLLLDVLDAIGDKKEADKVRQGK